jgi:hypothetical protein
VSGQTTLVNHLYNTVPEAGDRFTEWWSATDGGNVVVIVDETPSAVPGLAPKE